MNNRRLLACAKLCKGKKAVDVGTDHGLLAEYLIKTGICEKCIACDINEKPLNSARETVKKAGLEDKIELVLSDGLDMISPVDVTDVIIAGMGGELIVDIINRANWLKENRVNLVLQPMTKCEVLRKYLYDNDFEIVDEIPCSDGKFIYSVMQAVYIGEKPDYDCDEFYLYAGKVTGDCDDGRIYLNRQADRLETAGRGMIMSLEKKSVGEEMILLSNKLREVAGG